MGYLPDDTLLLVGAPAALEAAANHSLFLWAGEYAAEYKVAPEWGPLLDKIDALMADLDLAGSGGGSSANGSSPGGSPMSESAASALAAALRALPLRVAARAGGAPLVGIIVAFPAPSRPQPSLEDAAQQESNGGDGDGDEGAHAGDAAAADWAPLLGELCGGGVEVRAAGPYRAVVFAPAPHLRRAVAWLAARPAAHWVAPLARHALRNRQASSITQAGVATPRGGAASTPSGDGDPALHPVWAAGVTGEGQVLGIGDSGLGERQAGRFRGARGLGVL
jgi:hypothetical protein